MTRRLTGLLVLGVITFAAAQLWESRGEEASGRGHVASVDVSDQRLAPFSLSNQFGDVYTCRFPASQPIVLLAADKKGYESLDAWIVAVRSQLRGKAEVVGVADLRAVPGFLRGKVERKFKSVSEYPVLLDWSGDALESLNPSERVPNVYLISREGRVLLHQSGEVTAAKLGRLLNAIETGSPPDAAKAASPHPAELPPG